MPDNEHAQCRKCGDAWGLHFTRNDGVSGCVQQVYDQYNDRESPCDCSGYEEVMQHYRVQLDINHKAGEAKHWINARVYDNTTNAPRQLSKIVVEQGEDARIKAWNHFCKRLGEITGIFPEE